MSTALNITSPKLVKNAGGTVLVVSVIFPGSGPGMINDCAGIGAAAAENQVAVIPPVAGVYQINFVCTTGIVVTPGPGQQLAVNFA
jgi:hypothetical protein